MQRAPDNIEDIDFIVDKKNMFHAATALGARVLASRGRRTKSCCPQRLAIDVGMEDTFIDDLVLKERTSHLGYIGVMSGSVQDSGDRRRSTPTF
jgi:hypothetical protein